MNLKKFLKPDLRKIAIFGIFIIYLGILALLLFGSSLTGLEWLIIASCILVLPACLSEGIYFPVPFYLFIIMLTLVWLYLLSCFIVWIYDKYRKKK